MSEQEQAPKERWLREQGVFNTDATSVADSLFQQSEFFDPRDLLLVKYEMLRRVLVEEWPVAQAAVQFGFSRSGYYKVLAAWERGGLSGLLPVRPGPRGGHKLTDEVLDWLDTEQAEQPIQSLPFWLDQLAEQRGVKVHRRSLERARTRRKKGAS